MMPQTPFVHAGEDGLPNQNLDDKVFQIRVDVNKKLIQQLDSEPCKDTIKRKSIPSYQHSEWIFVYSRPALTSAY
jgi:hypothetical protein